MTANRPLVPAPLARGVRGAVVAPHHLATAAGLGVLRAGGSAVDAAIATNAVLGVVLPHACGLGGDAFWLIWEATARRLTALNGSGRSAATVDAASVRAAGHASMPLLGPSTITVPGAVRSWADAHRRFGRLGLDAILAPAIELARDGFAASDGFVDAVEESVPAAIDTYGPDTGCATVFRPHGRPWRAGERVQLPALATTLEGLADDGLDAFYDGDLGEHQARALGAAGSPIAVDDLRTHASTWREPISIDYRGVRVTTHPPNSSGLVALEMLGILRQFDPPMPGMLGRDSTDDARWIHLVIEASKAAMADRTAYLTDPDVEGVPVARLLDPAYHRELAARVDPQRASATAATIPSGGGTAYLAVVDGDGNAVSLIQSLCWHFGSGFVDPATGIAYQNRGAYFSLEEGHPNVLAPRKRTLHTLLPGMLFRDDEAPWIVVGSRGLDAQPQIHAQFVSGVVDRRLDVASAIAAPRWFAEPPVTPGGPTTIYAESRLSETTIETLRGLGHEFAPAEPFDEIVGHEHAIELVDGGPSGGGSVAAATDPRSEGLPAVW